MTEINPKYLESCQKGLEILELQESNRNEAFYENYDQTIVQKHRELRSEVQKVYELSQWPKFSLKKIKLFAGETLTDLLLANAIALSEGNDEKAKQYYFQLATKRVSLASPFFNNLRKPGEKNLASCFIMEVDDSLDSIMKSVTYCAKISKAGGGAGVNVGKIRSKGASVNGNKNAASSVMNWIRLFDQVCVSVNQLGQRPGAITVALPIWHADIEEFLDCQTENGDLRAKAYNIQPQVVIPDEFMFQLECDGNYNLFCPKDLADNGINTDNTDWYLVATKLGLTKRVVKARHLWKVIQEQQRTVGRPYLFFINNAQKNSPFRNIGNIRSSNLCVESYSYFLSDKYIHCCNLISINLAAHESLETIVESAMLATEMADTSLDISSVDIPEVVNHVRDFRTIGVGLMGLADWLAYNGKYYSDVNFIEVTAQAVALACYASSVRIAAVKGACGRYSEMQSELWDKCDELMPEVKALRIAFGIRNSMLLATAPNTTTSLTMGSTASFLPPYQLEFYDESEDHSLNVLVKYNPELYLTNFQVNPLFITAATEAIQKWTDAGISMEYLLPNSASWSTNKSFSEIKIDAWKKGIKAVYYTRSTEDAQNPGGCSACAN